MAKFKLNEISGEELGGLTIDIKGLPVYGEGETREEALADLIDSVIELCELYTENDVVYNSIAEAYRPLMDMLVKCNGDRNQIRKTIGL